jgi:hypothetical protein
MYFNSNQSKTHFVLYPQLILCHNGSFSLEFRTATFNGLIFYAHDGQHTDFIVVSIYRGKLLVEQQLGKYKSHQQFEQSVNDDRWYKIVFKRRSSLISEIFLYSVALRNMESRVIKSKQLNYVSLTDRQIHSNVYLGGLPAIFVRSQRLRSDYLLPSFHGYIRNLRYGLCGCPERIQQARYSTLTNELSSEICEQQLSLCSSSSCECLNVDEEPRYQCDCSNKTCSTMSTSIRKWLLCSSLDTNISSNE